ncbi:uncharacterized protein M421DRAFT_259788 [Didymella exigua CBS 183.55]|uniref:Uncharacterized protein n=1 Tax=Didymella exigua CBS 183.55 TaxID=1150837 RepID=A0A6A5RAR8_9PLEO|nr:uncharacterized protein M421DRAFT_259788 [Didymella exigua CBS 183.55]KAF1925345.1 hypothetical protein M421DRAFT_259788 [Didymella exigua CBS 183.55]
MSLCITEKRKSMVFLSAARSRLMVEIKLGMPRKQLTTPQQYSYCTSSCIIRTLPRKNPGKKNSAIDARTVACDLAPASVLPRAGTLECPNHSLYGLSTLWYSDDVRAYVCDPCRCCSALLLGMAGDEVVQQTRASSNEFDIERRSEEDNTRRQASSGAATSSPPAYRLYQASAGPSLHLIAAPWVNHGQPMLCRGYATIHHSATNASHSSIRKWLSSQEHSSFFSSLLSA